MLDIKEDCKIHSGINGNNNTIYNDNLEICLTQIAILFSACIFLLKMKHWLTKKPVVWKLWQSGWDFRKLLYKDSTEQYIKENINLSNTK